MSEQLRAAILLELERLYTSARSPSDRIGREERLAEGLAVSVREVRRNLEIMGAEGTVQDLNVSGGLHVVITAEGLRVAERLRADTPADRPNGFRRGSD